MMDSATLKIDRAAKHVTEINELFCKQHPFSYILETDARTRERATLSKENEPVIHAGAFSLESLARVAFFLTTRF